MVDPSDRGCGCREGSLSLRPFFLSCPGSADADEALPTGDGAGRKEAANRCGV